MTENILNQILNSEIPIDDLLNWLTTDNPNDIVIAGIEQTDSTRAEFVLYFLDYLRKQCQGVLCSASSDGSEVQKPFIDIPPKTSGNITSREHGNFEHSSSQELMDARTKIGSPIAQPIVKNTMWNNSIASVSTGPVFGAPGQAQISGNLHYESPQSHSSPLRGPNGQPLGMQERNPQLVQSLPGVMSASQNIRSPIHTQMAPGILQYESPHSHSSPFSGPISGSFSRHEGNLIGGEYYPAIMSRWQVNDSCSPNLSTTSAVPYSPISPLYTNPATPTEPRTSHNRKSRRSFNSMNSPGPNANSGQKNKKSDTHRTSCLGDFIVVEKSNPKQRNRNNSGNKSMEQSPGQLNKSSEVGLSVTTQQKNSNSRRRIKPTKIVVNSSAENQQPVTFGVVSRPPTSNPTFIEALSTDETNEVKSYEDERELLKLQRQKQPVAPSVTEDAPQEPARSLIKPKQTPVVLPQLDLVEYVDTLGILAELHGGLLTKNLVPNPMTELYFIMSLITCQYRTDCEVKRTQIQRHDKLCGEIESLKELKETMGCADLIDDNSEENIGSDMKDSMKKNESSSLDEPNEKNDTQLNANEKQYFNTVHNCVYFATAVLWNAKNVLSVCDRPTLAVLCENPLVQEFHSLLHGFLNKLYEEKCSQSKNMKPYDYSRSLQSTVCFQVDTDNRDNFPSTLAFATFRRQRDMFYEILKIWEDNHMLQNWSFQKSLGHKINTMLSMHSDAGNYYHLARLFKSQLLLSSIKIGQAEDSFHDASLDILKSLKDLNPEKLQQLQQRLVTPVSSMGPVPPPSFPGIQEFYKKFLLISADPKFTTNLQDCFIQEIMELNDTQFMCSDIDAKESKTDESTKQNYLLCISTLRLLAKFLGFLISIPYQSRNDTLQSETTQIALRSRIMPPVDLQGCLYQAIAHKKLSVTIPWMVQYLAMLDSISFRLPYYLNICKSLYCIYRETKYSLDNETALLVAFSIGWFFELSSFPRDIYFHWMKSLKSQKDELTSDLAIYTCKKVLPITDDSGANCHQKNVVVDELNIIDDRALYICCPYLKEFKLLLTSGNANLNSNNANRHITPVSSELSQASSANRTISLELQLEEAFFHGHPRSVRKTVDFIVERIASSCVKFICRSIIPVVKEKTFRIIKTTGSKSASGKKSKIDDLIASTTAKIRDQCWEVIPGMCESKTKSSMEALLADDVLPAVKEMCAKIAVRMELEQIYQWLDSYINNAMMSKAMFLEFEALRIDDEDKDDDDDDENDDGTIGRTRIKTNNDDVPWATSVLKCVRNSLWELLENNGRWSTLDKDTVLDNVNKIYESLTGSKAMVPNTRIVLYRMSVDYAIHLITLKPDLFTPDVEEQLVKIWQTHSNDDDASNNKLLSGLLSPRNVKILMLSKDNTVWVRYGKFIQRLFKHNLASMDNFSNDCVSLLRYEWSPSVLQSFSKCMTEAILDYKSGTGEFVDKIMMLLDWIIQTCGTMDVYS